MLHEVSGREGEGVGDVEGRGGFRREHVREGNATDIDKLNEVLGNDTKVC